MCARIDDHVIAARSIGLCDGRVLPAGTHGFVTSIIGEQSEAYEVEFDVPPEESTWINDYVRVTVLAGDFRVA